MLQLPSVTDRPRVTEDTVHGFRVTFSLDPTLGEVVQWWKAILAWLVVEISLGRLTSWVLYQLPLRGDPLVSGLILTAILMIPCTFCVGWVMAINGHQVVQIHGDRLLIYHEPRLFERPKVYHTSEIRNLRYAPFGGTFLIFDVEPVGGRIAFDYRNTIARFGPGATETESHIIITAINERFKIAEDAELGYSAELL
jgi:hypothetical protein